MNTTAYHAARRTESCSNILDTILLEQEENCHILSTIDKQIQLRADVGDNHLTLKGFLQGFIKSHLIEEGYEVTQFQTYVQISW